MQLRGEGGSSKSIKTGKSKLSVNLDGICALEILIQFVFISVSHKKGFQLNTKNQSCF